MSCHTPCLLTRTLTAFRRGGWYTGIPGTRARTPLVVIDGMSDTTAPPLLLRRFRPCYVVWRARLLGNIPQSPSIHLPLFPCGAHRNWSVREHDPVCLRKPAISLSAKRGPRLGLSFLFNLLFGAPRPCNVGHYSITSGSGNLSESGASGPWNRNSVTSSFPFTRRAASTGQMSSVVSRADTSSSPSGRPLKSNTSLWPSRVAVMVSPWMLYERVRSLRCGL